MNCNFKHLLRVTLLVSTAALVADATTAVIPYFSARSQSQDLARLMSGTVGHIYRANAFDTITEKNGAKTESWKHNGNFAFTPEYTRSFDGKKIVNTLFGCYYPQSCNKLVITGEHSATARTAKDLLADWFYLPSNYEGSVCFEPVVQNFNADFDLYWGMDKWAKGLFFRVHAPITWTKWNLGANFTTTVSGTSSDGEVTYLNNAENFFCTEAVSTSTVTGTTFNPLTCARFCGCLGCDSMTLTRLADIQADFGWNFLLDQDYHLGLFVRAVAPTGSKVKGEWLFEPVIGNGRHWELGGGLTSSAILWRNQEESKHFGFYVDANVTHLFNAKQNRVFDLKNNPLSRYMSAYKVVGGINTFSPIANLTSCEMKVNVAVQADVTAMFNYTSKNWSYDLGYNFWYKSCEKFDCKSCCDDCCTTCTNSCDNDCNSCGCCGACIIKNGNTEAWSLPNQNDTINARGTGVDLLLTDSMIDYDGARTKGMSNKVFGHIAYSWNDREVVPYLGLGGSVEFGRNTGCCDDCNSCSTDCCSTNSCCNDCSCCNYVSLSQWGIWLKGGCSF